MIRRFIRREIERQLTTRSWAFRAAEASACRQCAELRWHDKCEPIESEPIAFLIAEEGSVKTVPAGLRLVEFKPGDQAPILQPFVF